MRQISLSGSVLRDVERGQHMEWLVTNGRGGFASGTVIGANTRRYHGLLLAAPCMAARSLLVAQVQEEATVNAETRSLGACFFPGVVHPKGYEHLLRFTLYPYPTWTYVVSDGLLVKSVAMVYGKDISVVRYRWIGGERVLDLRLRPMLALRDYHATRRRTDASCDMIAGSSWIRIQGPGSVPVRLAASGSFAQSSVWYENVSYPEEESRGLDHTEDLFVPGDYLCQLRCGEEAWLVAAAEHSMDHGEEDASRLVRLAFSGMEERQTRLLQQAGNPAGVVANLALSADAFVITRDQGASIVAGYPWFTDWGRDAMIAIPGLLLATGRSREALSVLRTFAAAERDGLIPNRFPDRLVTPEYNTVDAPLWFIYACHKYVEYTGDIAGLEPMWPAIHAIIAGYRRGTRFGIGVDSRGLVRAGEPGYQLTWMDAKAGDWVVTPREGYPVEISALWHSALRCAAALGQAWDPAFALQCSRWAQRTSESFLPTFWLADQGYLADVVDDDGRCDAALRPNQLFALSLPYPLVGGAEARSVVGHVWRELYTPLGIRSLSRRDATYHGVYVGDQNSRDSAYHRGTVWSWLTGPFITAYRQAWGRTDQSRQVAMTLIAPLLEHLWEDGLGHVSEIFDGDPPHHAKGCPAQAWSVAELLRLWVEEFGRQPFGV